jgi:hypothetical protein
MYAMSVSPLSLDTLERISPLLLSELGVRPESRGRGREEAVEGERKKRGGRDFTNNIKIGNEIFPIENIKGKKHVTLPWEKCLLLKELFEKGEILPDDRRYKGIRGAVIFEGNYTLLGGEKLSLILTLLPSLNWESARNWPGKENFNSREPESLAALLEKLSLVLEPALWGKNKTGRERKSKELGFIALFTDGQGAYWFRCSRGFHTALNESIASLEALIDELGNDVDIEMKHEVNQAYRRLSDYLGNQA